MMTSAQVVETSVTTTDNSPSQDYTHSDDQITLLNDIKIKFTSHLQRPKIDFCFIGLSWNQTLYIAHHKIHT